MAAEEKKWWIPQRAHGLCQAIRLASEEGENAIDLGKVTYMRVLPGDANGRIGFGGA